MLDQNAGVGNVGRFRVLTTAGGLVIAPKEATILDSRISFAETDGSSAFLAFYAALHPEWEGRIGATGPMESCYHARISVNNEVARDVLAKLLNGLHRVLGVHSIDELDPEPTYTWDLTTDLNFGVSILQIRRIGNVYRAPVIMEKPPDR
jgi:hypothetical protein